MNYSCKSVAHTKSMKKNVRVDCTVLIKCAPRSIDEIDNFSDPFLDELLSKWERVL